ncbi:hypothetical protein CC86DRAFT_411542 [Ophiobolus disseminans]|uniref:Uncharacterized protein n=1 Tax=Ophiobolus disseminans TaxID=1469910 RepID=A0A6A6ZJT5_9PLEO|nr:hypothetical protein CC86DRAFT_411542 [Ophiobolus disseminans]
MDLLHNTDIANGENIKEGNFFQRCLEESKKCLVRLGEQLELRGRMDNVHDSELPKIWKIAQRFWPLIHHIYLATVYGDTNQIRNANTDKARASAHFEILVVPSSRSATNETHDQNLDRSISRRGANKTLLVTNKCDVTQVIKDINEEPFLTLQARLEEIRPQEEDLEDTDKDDEEANQTTADIDTYKEIVLKAARLAYILREGAKIQAHVQSKGIDQLSTSARQFQLCKARKPESPPILDIFATGIPALRIFLLGLPARTNYRALRNHIFDTLPDIVVKSKQLQVNFVGDEGYAQMRENLAHEIPILKDALMNLSTTLVQDRITLPWEEIRLRSTSSQC